MTNKELGASGTVEPPASDHPKYEDLVVLTIINLKVLLSRKDPGTSTFRERIVHAFCKLCIRMVSCSN